MFIIIAVLTGVLLGLLIPYNLTTATLPYVAVAIIAALDSVFGGFLAYLNKKFNMTVFLIGLVSNAVLAVFLTYVGNILGINLSFAVIVVFGVRMFNNMASIRRLTVDIYFEKRAREKERQEVIKNRRMIEAAEIDEEVDESNTESEETFEGEEKNSDASEEKAVPVDKNGEN